MNDLILKTSDLDVYYGESQILRNISLDIEKNKISAIMGRNGVGKTTLLKTLLGLLQQKEGEIELDGTSISTAPTDERIRHGLAYVPQGREIFPKLSVYENLVIGLEALPPGEKKVVPEDELYGLFPVLGQMKRRMGGNLSGGQQQQLAIARALVGKPKILILDEPTEGIQPSIIQDINKVLIQLKEKGEMTIILVEQYFDFARKCADHFFLMERGQIALKGTAEELTDEQIKSYLTF